MWHEITWLSDLESPVPLPGSVTWKAPFPDPARSTREPAMYNTAPPDLMPEEPLEEVGGSWAWTLTLWIPVKLI